MPGSIITACVLSLLVGMGSSSAQQQVGTPVDRNVADTGPNAYSHRLAQPGLGKFGVGSLLLDRYDSNQPYDFNANRFDPFAGDKRAGVNHRYMLQSPGVTALLQRPDYIGPSPNGGWVRNAQTFDGAEIMTLTGANTVFVLSPELLNPVRQPQTDEAYDDHPYRLQLKAPGDPYQLMRKSRISGQVPAPTTRPMQRASNYRHPAIIERERRLREEAARQEAKKQAEQAEVQPGEPTPSD